MRPGSQSLLVCRIPTEKNRPRCRLSGTLAENLLRTGHCNVLALRILMPGLLGAPRKLLLPVACNPGEARAVAPFLRRLLPSADELHVFRAMITRTMKIHRALCLFFWVLVDGGWRWGHDLAPDDPVYLSATGITLSSILLMQIGNLVRRRSRLQSGIDVGLLRNPLLVVGIGMEMFFSWAVLYLEPVGRVLGTGPVAVHVYLVAWLGIPLIFGLDYLRKLVVRSRIGLPVPV